MCMYYGKLHAQSAELCVLNNRFEFHLIFIKGKNGFVYVEEKIENSLKWQLNIWEQDNNW